MRLQAQQNQQGSVCTVEVNEIADSCIHNMDYIGFGRWVQEYFACFVKKRGFSGSLILMIRIQDTDMRSLVCGSSGKMFICLYVKMGNIKHAIRTNVRIFSYKCTIYFSGISTGSVGPGGHEKMPFERGICIGSQGCGWSGGGFFEAGFCLICRGISRSADRMWMSRWGKAISIPASRKRSSMVTLMSCQRLRMFSMPE